MAINSTADRSARAIASKSQTMSVTDVVRAVLEPLASLKLTVFLLAFSVFVVWVITLEQTRMDFWELKRLHFGNAFVFVPFQSFLPLGLFSSGQGVSGGFWLPSGFVLIVAMLVNLTAAHVLRFRLQAKGLRLALGIAVLAGASFLTWAVIFNGQNSDGFQGQPPISYEHMWIILQIALFGLCVGSIAGCVTISRDRFVERILLGLFALALISVLGVTLYFGEEAFIGDSAMRILWQLMQSTLAAATGLAACILLFRRKAGIVLLHIGIAGLLLNEIYVSVTNEEQMLSFVEGETVSHAVDLRSTELAIIDRSDDQYDRLTVVPGRRLMESRNSGAPIDDPDIPFTIQCLEYFQNSSLGAIGPMQPNLANTGIGTSTQAMLIRPSTGTDVDRRSDKASAYVRLKDRQTGQVLGDYLLSQQVYENGFVDAVTVDGHDYQIGLRLKHIYKPYDVKLTDVKATYYPGTQTARWFSSDIELSNFEDGMSSKQRVWMNNPLRYGDETFYQTRYDKTSSGQEVSSLQVVKNRGWMIPYVCCMLVVTGLIAQFGSTLLSFLQKISSPQPSKALPILPAGSANSGESDRSDRKGWLWAWLPTIVLVGAFGYYAISQLGRATSAKVDKEGMKLELLGQVPVIYQGRVQPMDSLARNVARQLSKRELVVDKLGNKQPAIRWLADSIFEAPGYDQYEIMRVEDINVQNALQLPRRQGLKYTWDEIRGADQKMVELLIEAEKLPEEQWSDFQRRLRELYGKSRKLLTFRTSMRDTSDRCKTPGDDLERLEEASTLVGAFEKMVGQVPLAFPSKTDDVSWIPLSTALDRQWLAERAQHYGTQNVDELARKMIREAMIKASIISRLTSNEDFIKVLRDEMGLKDRQEIAQKLSEKWDEMPKALYQSSLPEIEKEIDQLLAKQPSGAGDPFSKMMRNVIGEDKDVIDGPVAEYVLPLAKLQKAYLENDAETFNTSLETYLANISQQPPEGFSPTRNHWETSNNEFSPFYLAIVIYLAAFLVTIFSWLFALAGWQQPINRAAFWLVVLGLAIHVGGIVARVVISGRPPVTNLYSSFVFVAALAVVILLVVEIMVRMGIGNLMASLCGFLALMWAWTLSIESGDTYTVLVAVLDTQFWLSTHVISVSIGYGATLAAGMLGLVLLLGSLFTPIFDSRMRKTFGKIIYGVICFALLFSFFGTVLGGLWADDSWGRFWGWDPKENGALMIVLWNAVSLHARWAGIVRERGLAALAVFGNIVTLWSWEGVNQLGVGLHAYSGMTSGASAGSIWMEPMFYLKAFVLLNLFACVVMMIPTKYWFSDAREAKLKAQAA